MSTPFNVEHMVGRQKGDVINISRATTPLSVADVRAIYPVTDATKQALSDANPGWAVPPMARTAIQTDRYVFFVPDDLLGLQQMNAQRIPETNLRQASQLIIAVQRKYPHLVTLPDLPPPPISVPDIAAPAEAYTYRPQKLRHGLSPSVKYCWGALSVTALFGAAALIGISMLNREAAFSRSTACETPTTTPDLVLVGSKYQNGLSFSVDKQGRVLVSQTEANGQKIQMRGQVSGNPADGYELNLPASRPMVERAIKVCLSRNEPQFN